jgi:hypothetical protein
MRIKRRLKGGKRENCEKQGEKKGREVKKM